MQNVHGFQKAETPFDLYLAPHPSDTTPFPPLLQENDAPCHFHVMPLVGPSFSKKDSHIYN